MAIGKDGVTQMGLEDVSIMRALPNMVVLNPATFSEALKVIEYLCETDLQSPHYLRLGRQPVEDIEMPFEFGKGHIVKDNENEYVDCTIISTGCILGDVVKAAEIVEKNQSFITRVVNMPTLKPIDEDMIIHCAEWSKTLVTVEDHTIVGGLGSAVSDVLAEHENMPPLYKIGLNDIFPESAPPNDLYDKYGLSAEEIARQVVHGLVDR
jgi:transketolase